MQSAAATHGFRRDELLARPSIEGHDDPWKNVIEKLAELQERIDDFSDAIPQPRAKIKSKKSVTQQLAEEFRAAGLLLTEGLDRLIGQSKRASPDFIMDYRNARVKVAKAATFDTAAAQAQPTVTVQPKSQGSLKIGDSELGTRN